MTTDRRRRVLELYHQALGRDADDRDAFLRDECAGDEELHGQVQSLLADEPPAAFLGPPAEPADVLDRPADRSLPRRVAAGSRWHGRGVPCPRHQAAARCRDQGLAPGVRLGSRAAVAIRARGARAGDAQSPAHRRHLRAGGRGRCARPRSGIGGRRDAGAAPEERRSGTRPRVARRPGTGRREADCGGSRRRARQGHRPPRSQAGQRRLHRRGCGEGAGLRPGQGDVRRRGRARPWRDSHRHGDGHTGLHESGAGQGRQGGQARRHLGVRLRAVRDAGGPAAVRGRDRRRDAGSSAPP